MLKYLGSTILIGSGNRNVAYETEIGAYELTLDHTPLTDPFEAAIPLELDADGAASFNGELTSDEDAAVFIFAPQQDGLFRIQLGASEGSGLDTVLTLFSGNRRAIRTNDDHWRQGPTDSEITYRFEGGPKYFLRASAYSGTAGKYKIFVRLTR